MHHSISPARHSCLALIKSGLLATLLLSANQQVLAEGAVRVLDCQITRLCNTTGQCETQDGKVQFRMAPQALDASGAGQYNLQVDGIESAMQAQSEIGPFYWNTGPERHTLLASSETRFVWHTLSLAAQPEGNTRFLACTFQQ